MGEAPNITERGESRFQVCEGRLLNSAANVQKLRALWLDRRDVNGEALGPGDAGDFDHGAWHVSCHLVAASGIIESVDHQLLWLEISHDPVRDRYFASVTGSFAGEMRTIALDSAEGREAVCSSRLRSVVEGNSAGRTSARNMCDSPTSFNLWRRQDFDQPPRATVDGGKVWEHWCTLRDIRTESDWLSLDPP